MLKSNSIRFVTDTFGEPYDLTANFKSYTIVWKNHDGTVLEIDQNAVEGTLPSYDGETPTKADDATYTYTFRKWTPTIDIVSADIEYTAVFNRREKEVPAPNNYTVIWKNYDGTVLETLENVPIVLFDAMPPAYEGETPTRPDDDTYTYTFLEWFEDKPQLDVVEYTAVFSKTEKKVEPILPKTAFLVSKVALNCTNKSSVESLSVAGNAPTGSIRRLVFKLDDDKVYFFKSGVLTEFAYEVTYNNVIKYGNKPADLNALSNITAFVGRKIYPIIALKAPYDAEEFPTVKVTLNASSAADQLVNTEESTVYELSGDSEVITEITPKTTLTGNATLEITVRLREEDEWTSYMKLEEAADKKANAVQFKVKSTVTTTDGTDSARVDSITVSHTSGETIVTSTSNNSRIYSVVQNYAVDLQTCYVVVRHDPLFDSEITAYVNFAQSPKHRELITIGTGTGQRQELTLGAPDKNIVASSIRLYVDEAPFYDFDFSTELSTVILTAKKNGVITASYNYDYGIETFKEMTPRIPQPYNDENGTWASRFFFCLSQADSIGKNISNVQIRLKRLTGTATENLGKATGKKQLFLLKHNAKPSTISFTNNVDFSFDEPSGILSLVAPKNTALVCSYDWRGKPITVRSFAAGWIPNSGFDYQEGDFPNVNSGTSSIPSSFEPYELPTMAPNVKGGAKNGTGLVMADDTVNVDLRTAVTVSATDAEPRVYVIRSIDDLIAEYPDLTENDLGELSGVENHKYFLIDDIYFVADANTPSGGLFHPGEWYVPVRGQENFTVQSSAGYFDYEQGKFVVDDSTKKDLVAGQDYFIGLDDAEEQPILTFYHEGTHYPDVYGNATIWADGHDAVEGAKSIGNIVLGNNLSLTGDTLNASGGSSFQIGDGFYLSYAGDVGRYGLDQNRGEYLNSRALFQCFDYVDFYDTATPNWSYDRTLKTMDFDRISTFYEWYRPPKLGDIAIFVQSPGSGSGCWAYRARNTWFVLDYVTNYASADWDTICPLLTVADRKLLDYLHAQFDSQIPT